MTDPRIASLTVAERDALRALHRHRHVSRAAEALGKGYSTVRTQLESATKRTGLPRWDLTWLLGVEEGWIIPKDDLRPTLPIGDDDEFGEQLSPSAGNGGLEFAETRPSFDHGPSPAISVPLPRLMRNGVDDEDLTTWRRVAAILIWCLIGIMIFCLLIATMTAFSLLGVHLQDRGVTRI